MGGGRFQTAARTPNKQCHNYSLSTNDFTRDDALDWW